MILGELKAYLKQHRRATMPDLTNRFDVAPDALRGMLQQFERKGRVRRINAGGDCSSGCNKCDAFKLEIWEWAG